MHAVVMFAGLTYNIFVLEASVGSMLRSARKCIVLMAPGTFCSVGGVGCRKCCIVLIVRLVFIFSEFQTPPIGVVSKSCKSLRALQRAYW